MLLYKSSLSVPRLPSRRKYREVARRHGDAWRSVSAEPSFASTQRSSSPNSVGRERTSAWSGAPEATTSGRGSPLASPERSRGSLTAQSDSLLSNVPSTASSNVHRPALLRGKRVNSIHVQGVLSDWSTEFPAAVVAETMHIIFDESTDQFDCTLAARLKTSKAATDQHIEKRQKALDIFDSIAERRGILGMCGDVGQGPDAGLIPANAQEKMRMTKPGTASCGPICSFLNERTEREQNAIQRALEESGVSVQAQAPDSKNTLKFEFLGADEEEPNVFYFEQTNVHNPHNSGRLKWRLSCFVDRVWKSAAPRPYGPSRDWGGAWGGIASPFTNNSSLHQPGNTQTVGGHWQKVPRFFVHVIDEVRDRKDFVPPSPGLAISAMVNLPTKATLPSFESSRQVPFQKHRVPRTFSSKGQSTSYCVQKSVQIGRPRHGYPGCADRTLPETYSGEGAVELSADAFSPVDPSHMYREGFAFQDRHDERRLTNSSAGARPQALYDAHSSESPSMQARKLTPIELKGSPKVGTANQYRRTGGPSHHRANLESWRMPHTQAHTFEKLTYDRLLSTASEEARQMLQPRPFPSSMSAGRAAFTTNAVSPNFLAVH